MRTTIAIKPEHRAKLLELAARRGEKDFSSVIAEALEAYLEGIADREQLRRHALRLRGALPKTDAERLRKDVDRLRRSWR